MAKRLTRQQLDAIRERTTANWNNYVAREAARETRELPKCKPPRLRLVKQ